MHAYVYLLEDRRVITIVPDVVEVGDGRASGKDAAVAGVDITKADIIVSDQAFNEGDVLPVDVVDHSAEFYKQKPEQLIAQLQAENSELRQQMAQQNADFTAFQDFYFEKNPEQA